MTARYYPEIFRGVVDEDDAKRIILTNEGPGADTATRWAVETPYVLELGEQCFEPPAGHGGARLWLWHRPRGEGNDRDRRSRLESDNCCSTQIAIAASTRRPAPSKI
jgi:hypothetical protein